VVVAVRIVPITTGNGHRAATHFVRVHDDPRQDVRQVLDSSFRHLAVDRYALV
jgi:hypothetical protein